MKFQKTQTLEAFQKLEPTKGQMVEVSPSKEILILETLIIGEDIDNGKGLEDNTINKHLK